MRLVVAMSVLVCISCSADSQSVIDPKAQAVIDRSQRTTATYSVYHWNDVPEGGAFEDGWSAEFHSDDLHRVETPMSRSVADCRKRTGTNIDLKSGKVISNYTVANAACGINTNFAFRAVEWLGRQKGAFGEADRVRVTDDNTVRTYEVLDNGATVTAIYVDRQGKPLVTGWATALLETVPEDIFSEESLSRSVVPDQYKRQPTTSPTRR